MNFKDGSKTGGWGCLGVIVVMVIFTGLAMLIGALGIGSANSWFFDGNFSDGWSAAWAKPWVLLAWTVLFYGIVAGAVFGRD